MNHDIIELDGISIRLQGPDLDGDGKIGDVETVTRFNNVDLGTQAIMQPSDLTETLKQMNEDKIDATGMSSIDMKTRLNLFERNGIVALDSLVGLGVCPPECLSFTRQMKRLNVSLLGKGREEFVKVVTGERDHQQASGMGGFVDKIKSKFGGNQ